MSHCFGKKSHVGTGGTVTVDPNPLRYKVLLVSHFDNVTLIKVKYLDCKNFEGDKILIYKGYFRPDPTRPLDPHFSDSEYFVSPIARFEPSKVGMDLAVAFCKMLDNPNTPLVHLK
jgi:hypothetical protein